MREKSRSRCGDGGSRAINGALQDHGIEHDISEGSEVLDQQVPSCRSAFGPTPGCEARTITWRHLHRAIGLAAVCPHLCNWRLHSLWLGIFNSADVTNGLTDVVPKQQGEETTVLCVEVVDDASGRQRKLSAHLLTPTSSAVIRRTTSREGDTPRQPSDPRHGGHNDEAALGGTNCGDHVDP